MACLTGREPTLGAPRRLNQHQSLAPENHVKGPPRGLERRRQNHVGTTSRRVHGQYILDNSLVCSAHTCPMRHLTFQREGEREASGSFTVALWLLGIFGVYLSDALSDLHTGKERGEQADPS